MMLIYQIYSTMYVHNLLDQNRRQSEQSIVVQLIDDQDQSAYGSISSIAPLICRVVDIDDDVCPRSILSVSLFFLLLLLFRGSNVVKLLLHSRMTETNLFVCPALHVHVIAIDCLGQFAASHCRAAPPAPTAAIDQQ